VTGDHDQVVSRNPADPADIVVELPAPGVFATVEAVEQARVAQPAFALSGRPPGRRR